MIGYWTDDLYHCNQPGGRRSYAKVSGSCSVPAQISVISLFLTLYILHLHINWLPCTQTSFMMVLTEYLVTFSHPLINGHLKSSMVEDENMLTLQTSQQACLSLLPKAGALLLVRFAPLTLSKYTWEQMYIMLYILYFANLVNLSLAI